MNKDIYQIKIIYTDAGNRVEGMPYRIIQFHIDTNLQQLAQHILKNFNFKMSEPFGFYTDILNWHKSEFKYELFEEDPKKNTLKNTFIDEIFEIQKEFLFIYDYLEEYRFLITLEKQVPERNVTYPEVLESRGETSPNKEAASFLLDEEEDPIAFIPKKKSVGIRDEYDDFDEDELENLNGREGTGFDDNEDDLESGDADDFGFDEYGDHAGFDDEK
jgi:hypothetical protein